MRPFEVLQINCKFGKIKERYEEEQRISKEKYLARKKITDEENKKKEEWRNITPGKFFSFLSRNKDKVLISFFLLVPFIFLYINEKTKYYRNF